MVVETVRCEVLGVLCLRVCEPAGRLGGLNSQIGVWLVLVSVCVRVNPGMVIPGLNVGICGLYCLCV